VNDRTDEGGGGVKIKRAPNRLLRSGGDLVAASRSAKGKFRESDARVGDAWLGRGVTESDAELVVPPAA